MKQIFNLSKEERIKVLLEHIQKMSLINQSFQTNQFSPFTDIASLINIIEKIEDKIFFITEKSSFEFKNRFYASYNFECLSVDDILNLLADKSYMILYSLSVSPPVFTNPYVPGISKNIETYVLKCVLMNDPSIRRGKMLDDLLDD